MNHSYFDDAAEHMRVLWKEPIPKEVVEPMSDFAGGKVSREALKKGQTVLFWWHDVEAKKMRVFEGTILNVPLEGDISMEDAEFTYDTPLKDIIRIMKEV